MLLQLNVLITLTILNSFTLILCTITNTSQGTLESYITTHEMNGYENLKNKT